MTRLSPSWAFNKAFEHLSGYTRISSHRKHQHLKFKWLHHYPIICESWRLRWNSGSFV